MKEVLVLVWALGGCTHTPKMQACYAKADANFYTEVEKCKEAGLKYDECDLMEAAERRQDEAYAGCR